MVPLVLVKAGTQLKKVAPAIITDILTRRKISKVRNNLHQERQRYVYLNSLTFNSRPSKIKVKSKFELSDHFISEIL